VIDLLERLTRRRTRHVAPIAVRSTYRTHVGRVRSINEDRVLDRADRRLWAVADGMGGHSAGDRAAAAAIDALDALPDPITAPAILGALNAANRSIAAQAERGGSGTTIVVAWAEATRLRLFWAGDSRAYRVRDGRAVPLTRDHSLVQELVDGGLLSEAEAERHPQANVVTRALGIASSVAIETADCDLVAGDLILLCSDGLSRSLGPRDFAPGLDLSTQGDRLLMNALQRDGSDNASLVLVAAG
jgi:serine/threonine protein phosphatase PrpC